MGRDPRASAPGAGRVGDGGRRSSRLPCRPSRRDSASVFDSSAPARLMPSNGPAMVEPDETGGWGLTFDLEGAIRALEARSGRAVAPRTMPPEALPPERALAAPSAAEAAAVEGAAPPPGKAGAPSEGPLPGRDGALPAEAPDAVFVRAFGPETAAMLKALCASKAEEFRLLGYAGVRAEDLWSYFLGRYRREVPPLYRVVGDILGLRPNAFMTAAVREAWRGR